MKTKYNPQKSIFLFVQHYSMLWLLLFCISTATTYAQSPQKMTYQSVVRDASGSLLTNTAVGIQISILQGTQTGASIYTETYSPTPQTNINGLVSIEIGDGTPSTGVFANIDWSNGPYFLKVEIDPLGGTSYTITGTSQLLSVPYALYAETSGNANTNQSWNLIGNSGINSANNFIGTTDNQPLKFKVNDTPFGLLTENNESVFFGARTGLNNVGSNNIGLGSQALLNSTGSANIGIGPQALEENTSGQWNIALGDLTLQRNTMGDSNIGLGNSTLHENTTGDSNIAIGNSTSYFNFSGNNNIALGEGALKFNGSGSNNIALGKDALSANLVSDNIGIGNEALLNITTGDDNTAIGNSALLLATDGQNNTAIGFNALSQLDSGWNNTGIGHGAQVPNAFGSHQVQIGNSTVSYAGIEVAWTITSDVKKKEQIRSLPYGLDFVSKLKPVDYVRKNNETKTREMGFIAQDVEKLLAKVGYTDQGFLSKDSKGGLSLRYNDFIALLTKAIQELNDSNKSLQKMNSELVKRIEKLEQQH